MFPITDTGEMNNDNSNELLSEYQEGYNIPEKLFRALVDRRALPSWAKKVTELRISWLADLHKNVTEGWPPFFSEASAGLLPHGKSMASALISESARAIVMPVSTPAYLNALREIIAHPFVHPESPDPEAKMLIDGQKMNEAVHRLEWLLGMLQETGYLEPNNDEWHHSGGVVGGTRFLYYHELSHLVRAALGINEPPNWIVPGEEYLAEELAVDQLADCYLTLEVRNYPHLQTGMSLGIVLALSLIASKEYVETLRDGRARIKSATLRIHRLFYWGQGSVDLGALTEEALEFRKFWWDLFRSLLMKVEQVPSPISSLLMQTADRPETDWQTASNQILKWCVFGDRQKVCATIRKVRDDALSQAAIFPKARRVLDVIDFLLEDTSLLEPELGLRHGLS